MIRKYPRQEVPFFLCSTSQDPSLDDAALAALLREAPRDCVLLLEDVDAAFSGREYRGEGRREGGLSFSGLLNAVDGVAAQEGRLLVLTTNHPEGLDPALLRPGRVDLQVQIGPATAAQARRMLVRFNPAAADAEEEELANFGTACAGRSMAEIQGVLLRNRDRSITECLRELQS
eukprot:Hpha_TRINITY_DN9395_c0_g1::TRINITY_DN9395_c0_g1_i1::g.25851::m.25851/K08900/BCS1; mitochondrial chaperone BCS1